VAPWFRFSVALPARHDLRHANPIGHGEIHDWR
jgi:hypothetical protein